MTAPTLMECDACHQMVPYDRLVARGVAWLYCSDCDERTRPIIDIDDDIEDEDEG